jgi:hypothetical protein
MFPIISNQLFILFPDQSEHCDANGALRRSLQFSLFAAGLLSLHYQADVASTRSGMLAISIESASFDTN